MHQARVLTIAALSLAALAAPAAAETITGTFRYNKIACGACPAVPTPIALAEVDIFRFHPLYGSYYQWFDRRSTDANGVLSMQAFHLPGTAYRVQVRMKDLTGGIYMFPGSNDVAFAEPPIVRIMGNPSETLDFSFTFGGIPAGGFNILRTIAIGNAYASARRDPFETDQIGFGRVEMQSLPSTAFFDSVTSTMRLLTGQEMNDAVTLHEYGHLLEQRISTISGLGGSHTLCNGPPGHGFAWVEGFADYFAEVVNIANPGALFGTFGGFETPVCPPSDPEPGVPRDQIELFVAAALFDLADNNQDGGDAYCSNNQVPGDVRVFQIFDRELDNMWPSTPNLQLFYNAWTARGFDGPMLQSTLGQSGVGVSAPPPAVFYDHLPHANMAIFRQTLGQWWIWGGLAGVGLLGQNGDIPVPADYDGDGWTDVATWRASDGVWRVYKSASGVFENQQWGLPGDIPMPGDYDGDNEIDFAVYRPSTQQYFVHHDGCGAHDLIDVGAGTPVTGDYDGDLRDDAGILDASGTFTIRLSAGGSLVSAVTGGAGATPVSLDSDGDGRTDFATFSNGTWRVKLTPLSRTRLFVVGGAGDLPVAADYDNDGRSDFATYTPSTGIWTRLLGGVLDTFQWGGQPGDLPAPAR